jgi:acetyl-CoA synthetase
MNGVKPTDELKTALVKLVRSEIGAIATVDKIQFAPNLPKTRSGKIMRRIYIFVQYQGRFNLSCTKTMPRDI